jgi:dTDP-4-amino-4,6-dideoxygalactose transaminase
MPQPPTILPADPRAGYLAHKDEIDRAVLGVLEGGRYVLGQEVAAFEREFAAAVGAAHAVGVGSGTDALHLALRACGVGPGDAVLTVSHTAVATVAAVELAGATPLLVDIDPATFTLDPNRLEDAVKAAGPGGLRPRAVVVVHLYGQPADLPAIVEVARRFGLFVVEDCAQSHGATLAGRTTGTWGDVAASSFYPTKNLGALGDGGAVLTGDDGLAERLRLLREYGWRERYVSEVPGLNSRLDEVQAAVLRVKLRHLAADNERRRLLARLYDAELEGAGLVLPRTRPGASAVYHQYVVRSPRRDALRAGLRERGVGTLVHYPVPVHLQPAYRGRVPLAGPLRHTERAAEEVLSLPMYPELDEADVRQVARHVREVG